MSQSIAVELTTSDKKVTWDLMEPEDNSMATGDTNEISEGAELTYNGTKIQKGLDIPSVVQMTLDVGSNVATGVVAAWLYDKLKDRDVNLTLGGEKVEVQKERIQTRLEELREK
jgi:hypothetical protein